MRKLFNSGALGSSQFFSGEGFALSNDTENEKIDFNIFMRGDLDTNLS